MEKILWDFEYGDEREPQPVKATVSVTHNGTNYDFKKASVSSSNCTDWLEVGQFFEEFSDEEIEELEEMITNYLTNKRYHKESWHAVALEKIGVEI